MKKFFVILSLAVVLAFGATQQANAQAIGARFGGGNFFGAEASFLTAINDNRWELDLGIGARTRALDVTFTASYQWQWNIVAGFNWFIGPAAQVHSYFHRDYKGDFGIGIGPQGGLEYDFSHLNVPIQVSLDSRPLWKVYFLGNHYDGYDYRWWTIDWGVNLGVRYIF